MVTRTLVMVRPLGSLFEDVPRVILVSNHGPNTQMPISGDLSVF
jgi:hypothetical protein